jgi:predicted metalloprotease with PDZ domain
MKSFNILIILLALLFTSLLFYVVYTELKRSNDENKILYSVTIDKDNPRLAKLRIILTPKDSVLYMSPGANKLEKRWATFVQNLNVKDENGKSIQIEELKDAKWKMHTSLDKKLIISYNVHLDHENYEWSGGIDGAAYTTELGVFYTGRSLFVLNGEEWKDIDVEFRVNNNWKITTPWNLKEGSNYTYKVGSISSLANSLIFGGLHNEVSFKREKFELILALGDNEMIARENEFRDLANGVLDYYIDLMGGIPNTSPENNFSKVVVVINSSDTTDGEAIGNNISILFKRGGDKMEETISKFIFAHEFYHLWNGKSFSPIDDNTEWFKEGFTNYYTIKALYNVGFLNEESFFDILSDFFYEKYINDSGVGKLSMTNGKEKHNHWGLIYSGGLFVGISQDIIIRKASNNEKSIDDLMILLFQKYGGTNESYSISDLQEVMTQLSGINQSDFFDTYINGTKQIPVDKYLNMAGFNAKILNKKLVVSKKEKVTLEQQDIINGLISQFSLKD